MDSAEDEGSPMVSLRTGRVRRHARRTASSNSHEPSDSEVLALQQEIVELTARNEALQRDVDALRGGRADGNDRRTGDDDDFPHLFQLVSQLSVERRAKLACRILEQVISEMSGAEAHGWQGKTLEDVQAIRKSLLLQMAEVANREATDVIQSQAPPQTPKTSTFVHALQGQLSEAVAQQAKRDEEWIKRDEHFSNAVADVLDLRPFTEAALEMLSEVGIDDASRIRLQDVLRADQSDAHNKMVARRVAKQVCMAKGLVGEEVDARDGAGRTALVRAAGEGRRGEVWLLLQAGAESGCSTERGRGAVHYACASRAVEALGALAAGGADLDLRDEEGRAGVHVCCARDAAECIPVLAGYKANLDAPDQAGETAGHVAAERNGAGCLQALIQGGASLHRKDKADGDTALHVAAYRGHPEAMEVLLAAGASLLTTNKKGNTPLHTAAFWGHCEAVQRLIDAKASPCAINKKGWTPLDLADSQAKDDCVAVLRRYEGWDPPQKALPPPPPPKPKPEPRAGGMQC